MDAQPENLMDVTRKLLDASSCTLPQIYQETGISFYWLRKFKSGHIKNPSVNTVQRLYEYLAKKPLLKIKS